MMMRKRWQLTSTFALLVIAVISSCGTVPDAAALLHTNPLYLVVPRFVGPEGPLTARQAQRVIAHLQEHQETPTDILQRHLAFEQALTSVPLTVGNKVTLLKDGPATYRAMLAAIRSARETINVEMYTFSDGPIGQMFANALSERQEHGIQVSLMYDGLGSLGTPATFFEALQQKGIAIAQYRPVSLFSAKLPETLMHRTHRKMLIVDGRTAFTGGINISEVYASGLGSSGQKISQTSWRDTDIAVEGPAVAEIQRLFIGEWKHQKGPPLCSCNYFPKIERQGDDIVRVIGSVPERFNPIYVTFISAITNSETSVYITDAYFAPDHQMLHALERAARRGIDVRILLPSQSDEPLIVSAARSHYHALLKAGVKIYEWQGEMLHAKTATVDGVWSTVGSSNLDWWSIARNNEINAIVLSHVFADEMGAMFRNDLENSQQIELESWRNRSLRERLNETIAGVVEPML
jgi:cardiolipin synthase A/B